MFTNFLPLYQLQGIPSLFQPSHQSVSQALQRTPTLLPFSYPLQLSPLGSAQLTVPEDLFKFNLEQPAIDRLKNMTSTELKELGRTDKQAFFKALLPAALESERLYDVPAAVTLAQAALESGWGSSPIAGYNIFGIKGSGPAGTVKKRTKEFKQGKYVTIQANFARYNNFYEAIMQHGKVFQNRYFKRAMAAYRKDKNVLRFVDKMSPVYATAPHYARSIKNLIAHYNLLEMTHPPSPPRSQYV